MKHITDFNRATGRTQRMVEMLVRHVVDTGDTAYVVSGNNANILQRVKDIYPESTFDTRTRTLTLRFKKGGRPLGRIEFISPRDTRLDVAQGRMLGDSRRVFADHFALESAYGWVIEQWLASNRISVENLEWLEGMRRNNEGVEPTPIPSPGRDRS